MTYEEYFKNGDRFVYESIGFEELTDLIDKAIRKAKK